MKGERKGRGSGERPRSGGSEKQRPPLAPSVQRAHVRVQWAWYFSLLHGVLLVALAARSFAAAEPAWGVALLALLGAGLIPLLGHATYRGHTLSAHLLLATAAVPPVLAFFLGRPLTLPLMGLPFAVVYFMGVKGAIGLRGRRRFRRPERRA